MLEVDESVPPSVFHPMTVNAVVIEEKHITDSGQSDILFQSSIVTLEYLLSGWFIALYLAGCCMWALIGIPDELDGSCLHFNIQQICKNMF